MCNKISMLFVILFLVFILSTTAKTTSVLNEAAYIVEILGEKAMLVECTESSDAFTNTCVVYTKSRKEIKVICQLVSTGPETHTCSVINY